MKCLCKPAGIIFLVVMISSCGSTKNLQYMQGSFDTSKLSSYTFPVPVIQKGDLLGITVFSKSAKATAIYNQPAASQAEGGGITGGASLAPTATPGYLVNDQGDIEFQGLGKLHVEGLTKSLLTDLLNSKLTEYLTDPYYNIRFLNYKITIIGDVAHPSVFNVPAERINILEALGLAGDLNVTARRDNVRIIRETNGKREFGIIDLRQPDIFLSRFYQLQQNDIVYIDFNKSKAAANDAITLRNISVGTSVVATLAILYSIFKK
jgi:polysaccharide biosynthesis/export protein